jgi:hypothetical protein
MPLLPLTYLKSKLIAHSMKQEACTIMHTAIMKKMDLYNNNKISVFTAIICFDMYKINTIFRLSDLSS